MRPMSRCLCAVVVLAGSVVVLGAQTRGVPAGWFSAGSKPADYEMAVDPAGGRTGAGAFIKARTAAPSAGFGTLMQQFTGAEYRGKRLRLSAYVKAQAISDWAGLWMRVDGAGNAPLSFDNMQNRPIKGTLDWKRYEIVLDVPPNAVGIAFGILLSGPGQAWIDDLQFDVVGPNVPTTGMMTSPAGLAGGTGPVNLNFDK